MKTRYIEVPENRWGIVFVYGFNKQDSDEMSAIMKSLGMPLRNIQYALNVLATHNSGLTISNEDLRMSVVFVGKATSNAQWWDSVAHELKHVGDAIIAYYDKPYDGESAAYLQGYLFRCVVEEIAQPCF